MAKKKTPPSPAPNIPNTEYETRNSAFGIPYSVFLVALAALLAYWGAVGNGFVFFDDDKAILYNPALQNPSIAKFFRGQNLGMYAPMTWMAYWVGALISGQEAWGHHLLSVLLHAANAALAYLFLVRLTGRPYPALLAALLFAVHPVQAEAVAWAAALSTVLFSFFYLLGLNAYVLSVGVADASHPNGIKPPRYSAGYAVAAILLFVAACLSKSAAVTFPLVLVATDFYRNQKLMGKFWLSKIPFFLISLVFGLYTFSTREYEGHDIEAASAVFSTLDRVWMVAQTIWFYPFKLLLPFGFSIAYPFVKTGGMWPWTYYAALPALGAAGWLVWRFWKTKPELLLGLALYLLPLSVMLPFRTVGSFELRSDRYVYLSCLGLFFIGGMLLERTRREVQWAVLGVGVLILGFLAMQQTKVWNNGIDLFENCVRKTPDAALCQCNLAYNELLKLNFPASIEHYTNTLRLDSTYIEAYNGRGQAYLRTNKIPEALSDFTNAIRFGLVSPKLFLNQGKCLVLTRQYAAAIPALTRSLELEPQSPEAYFFRGQAHEQTGSPDKAQADFTKALEQKPDYIEVYEARAQTYMQNNQPAEAIEVCTRIIGIDPKRASAYSNRGYAHMLSGNTEQALADLGQAIALNPGFVPAYRIRAALHQRMGNAAAARADQQRAQQLSGGQ